MVLTVSFVLSLVIGLFVTIPGAMRQHRGLLNVSVETSGPHDFAVRSSCVRLTPLKRPPHPAPNVRDDRETPLVRRRDGGITKAASTQRRSEIFFANGLDKMVQKDRT
jgi:hypothetical protein